MKIIDHLSGSSLNSFDYDINQWYNTYILGIRQPDNPAFKFGRDYEEVLAQTKYKDYQQQVPLELEVWWYKFIWFKDFENETKIIECKTKSWWRSDKDKKTSWQIRLYNYCKWDKQFILHHYNKKKADFKEDVIDYNDDNFLIDIYNKAEEIREFAESHWVTIIKKSLDF